MNVGIVGSTGFIGQYLSAGLSKKFNIIEISLRNDDWKDKISKSEIIINLVGKAHDHKKTATEEDYYYTNLDLTKKLFREFEENESKLFIQMSSIAAIEEIESDMALDESFKSNSISWYGKSKREAEIWLLNRKIKENKKLIILRPPMVHGPFDKGNLALLFNIIKKGIPYPLGKFKNERSFISIYNLQYFLEEIIEKEIQITSGIYHLADDETVSTKDIIEIISTILGKDPTILLIPKKMIIFCAKIGDILNLPLNTIKLKKMVSNLVVSNLKIKKELNIKSLPYSAKRGLAKTIQTFVKEK